MSYFFTNHISAQIAINQSALDGRQFRLALFRYAPAMGVTNPAWRAARTVAELVATSPGWVEVTDVDGYPFVPPDHDTVIDMGSRIAGASRYIMYNKYPFAELEEYAEVKAIGIVLVGALGGVTDPLIFVSNSPLSGLINIRPGDALTSNPTPDILSGDVNRWLLSWAIVNVMGTATSTGDLMTKSPVVDDVYLVTSNNHWFKYKGPNPNDNLSKWTDMGVASVDPIEGPLVISLGSPEFEVSGSQHAWLYPQRINMIANPSFEAPGMDYWASNVPMARVQEAAPGGGYFAGRFTSVVSESYVTFPGSATASVSTPDSPSLSITGDLDLQIEVSPDDWSYTANHQVLMSKDNNAAGAISWRFSLMSDASLRLSWSVTGGGSTEAIGVAGGRVTFANGQRSWVRATLDVDNGAGGWTVTYYSSPDGVTWTILGTPVTGVGVTSIFDSTAPVRLGLVGTTGALPFKGKIHRARIYSGIQAASKTLVASPDFTNLIAQTTVLDGQGNTWTMSWPAAPAGDLSAEDPIVVAESNTFSTQLGEVFNEQWTIQLRAKGSGALRVGLIYWDADYRATAANWGESGESWVLSPNSWLHIAVHRHAPEAHLAMVRLECLGGSFTIDKVLAEPGYLKEWLYFDGDEKYGARDDFSWYGGMQRQGASYSLWYNHRNAVVGRLFARTVDPNDPTQNVTDEDMEEQGLVYRWVPAGITVVPHMDVLFPFDLQSSIPPKPPTQVLPYFNADTAPDGVKDPWHGTQAYWDELPGWDDAVWGP